MTLLSIEMLMLIFIICISNLEIPWLYFSLFRVFSTIRKYSLMKIIKMLEKV